MKYAKVGPIEINMLAHAVLDAYKSSSNICEPNPCRNCPNFDYEDSEDGKVAFCILGGGDNCDRQEE